MFQPNYLGQWKEGTVIGRQCTYLVNEMVPRHHWNLTVFILSNFLTLQNWVYTFRPAIGSGPWPVRSLIILGIVSGLCYSLDTLGSFISSTDTYCMSLSSVIKCMNSMGARTFIYQLSISVLLKTPL